MPDDASTRIEKAKRLIQGIFFIRGSLPEMGMRCLSFHALTFNELRKIFRGKGFDRNFVFLVYEYRGVSTPPTRIVPRGTNPLRGNTGASRQRLTS